MIYQCTKDMLIALKSQKSDTPDIYNDLFAWNVKLLKVNRRNLVYLMNDASKLSVIVYGMTTKEFRDFDDYIKQEIKIILEDCEVSNTIIHQYLEQTGEGVFCSSGTRKQLGVLNRAAMEAEYFFEEFSEAGLLQRRLSEKQNEGIVKNDSGDYITPKVVMKNLLLKTFGGNTVKLDLGEIALHMFMNDRMEIVPFLNIRDGSICVEERGTEGYEDLEYDDDYVCIQTSYFDFFYNFTRFAEEVENHDFQQDLNRLGHGKGAIRRIKDLLVDYPDVQKQWVEYKDAAEREAVREWLESMGLM